MFDICSLRLIKIVYLSLISNQSQCRIERLCINKTHPVGEKKANELGLYDLSGNVWEWCWDWYGDYPGKAIEDPKGPDTGSRRVLHGGSWSGDAIFARVAFRDSDFPDYRLNAVGFRLARAAVAL